VQTANNNFKNVNANPISDLDFVNMQMKMRILRTLNLCATCNCKQTVLPSIRKSCHNLLSKDFNEVLDYSSLFSIIGGDARNT